MVQDINIRPYLVKDFSNSSLILQHPDPHILSYGYFPMISSSAQFHRFWFRPVVTMTIKLKTEYYPPNLEKDSKNCKTISFIHSFTDRRIFCGIVMDQMQFTWISFTIDCMLGTMFIICITPVEMVLSQSELIMLLARNTGENHCIGNAI